MSASDFSLTVEAASSLQRVVIPAELPQAPASGTERGVGAELLPYYDAEGITIYCGEAARVIPLLGRFDLLLTDPKYGIGADKAAAKNKGKWGWKHYGDTDWDAERTPRWLLEMAMAHSDEAIVWGGNYFTDALPPRMGWLVWNKMQRDFSLADGELAWTSFEKALRICDLSRGKALTDGKEHPTQKSLELMRWCIEYADRANGKPVMTILDPFGGSGTTARAAKDMNRRCVIIEREERYCEIAARRLSQSVLALGAGVGAMTPIGTTDCGYNTGAQRQSPAPPTP